MQTSLTLNPPACCSSQRHEPANSQKSFLGSSIMAAPRRRRAAPSSRRTFVPQNFAGAAAAAFGTGPGLTLSTQLISELVSLVGFAFGAYYLGRELLLEQREGNPECSTCHGTGKVDCMCSRWSDGDRGCSICAGSGLMACPSCGGGGTAVPITAKVDLSRSRSLMDQQQG
jgi:hypothetical protein